MKYIYGRKQRLDRVPVPQGGSELEHKGKYALMLMYSRPLTDREQRESLLEFITTIGR